MAAHALAQSTLLCPFNPSRKLVKSALLAMPQTTERTATRRPIMFQLSRKGCDSPGLLLLTTRLDRRMFSLISKLRSMKRALKREPHERISFSEPFLKPFSRDPILET